LGLSWRICHIPPTVQGILAARIDRLAPDEKALLQQLSVIGRQFPLSLIHQVITQPEADLYRLFASLQHKEFLYEQPAFPESEYLFKHALTQEVAYGTVLQEQRKAWHERIGQAMEALYPENLAEHYSELAHHYSRSDNIEKAVKYLHLAGQQAARRSANADAMRFLTDAWDLLQSLPETISRHEQELTILVVLGPLWLSAKGWGTPEAKHVYLRAQEVCRLLGATPQLAPVLAGLSITNVSQAEYQTGYMFAEQLHQIALTSTDPELQLYDHTTMGITCLFLGEIKQASEQCEHGRMLYDVQQHHRLAVPFGIDLGLVCTAYSGVTLWYLGYPDQAKRRVQEVFRLASDFTHSMSRAMAPQYAAWCYQLCREGREALLWAEAAMAAAQEGELAAFLAVGRVFRGAALVQIGRGEEGVAELRQGKAEWQAVGTRNPLSYFNLMLADGFWAIGEVARGLACVEDALTFVSQTGEGFCEAELHRLKGELTLQWKVESEKSKVEEAEACFLKAIEVAQQQQAKSLELRAVMSLARLWQRQGKTTEARQRLAEIYGWFTEGFDTKDLQEARALLAELESGEEKIGEVAE
jgi:predicted ATPase